MNFTDFRGKLLDFLVADTGIAALVPTSAIHFSEISSLENPTYPCITVQIRSGTQDVSVHQSFPLIFGAHSEISQDEAMLIIQAIGTLMQSPIFPTLAGNVTISPEGTPIPVYIATARLYHVFSRFRCHRLGL